MSLVEVNMHSVSLEILDMLAELYQVYRTEKLEALRKELTQQIEMICNVLAANTRKISVQQQNDINKEIKRTRAILQLSQMESYPAFKIGVKEDTKISEAYKVAAGLILSLKVFDDDRSSLALQDLNKCLNLSDAVKKVDRDLVVKAIGLKAGHWFKCPNGHFYCIGECGGAMQTSKCIECGAAVGGGNHALLSDNQHAPELDGSKFAAWSETANNMANFRLNYH